MLRVCSARDRLKELRNENIGKKNYEMLLNIVRGRKRLAIETLHVLIKLIVNVSKDCLTFI